MDAKNPVVLAAASEIATLLDLSPPYAGSPTDNALDDGSYTFSDEELDKPLQGGAPVFKTLPDFEMAIGTATFNGFRVAIANRSEVHAARHKAIEADVSSNLDYHGFTVGAVSLRYGLTLRCVQMLPLLRCRKPGQPRRGNYSTFDRTRAALQPFSSRRPHETHEVGTILHDHLP